jgi:hypothetical protein
MRTRMFITRMFIQRDEYLGHCLDPAKVLQPCCTNDHPPLVRRFVFPDLMCCRTATVQPCKCMLP